jgi:hypothetical protein
MSPRAQHPLFRLAAWVAACCVLALTLFAASPDLHAGLHSHEGAAQTHHAVPVTDAGHVCVVTLFAHGVIALLFFCLLLLARVLGRGVLLRAGDEVAAAHPRYWLVPAHAPPAA